MAKKWWHDKDHPIWKLGNTALTGTFILAVFAFSQGITNTTFDANEIQAVGLSGGVLGFATLVKKMWWDNRG